MRGAMSRSKNKKLRHGDVNYNSSETLRKVHLTGEVTEDDINQLYMIWKPVCQGCRVNLKDSPNCFCGFVPHGSGHRKSGLWQKTSEVVASLGPDPKDEFRCPNETPAGLTNLGATCYANSILQCLYMNTTFRNGLFSLEPDILMQHPVLDQLFRLFAQLCFSNKAFVDSAPFTTTLDLDNEVQQDVHEFLTLLLSLLERCLHSSNIPEARTLVQDLFRGRLSHVTRCSMCGKESAASSKIEDFCQFELNIKGFNNLDESLDDYLSIDELSGENQYYCASCGNPVDATCYIKLQTLPIVLNFQLKRYVFLPKTTTRKKVVSNFSFPKQLEMGRRLDSSQVDPLTYDLFAILIHKGAAVNSGHYVAHIKDESTGLWWKFDDEHVSKLGIHPFADGSLKSCSNADLEGNGPSTGISHLPLSDNCVTDNLEIYSSSDAYMLMYARRNHFDSLGFHKDGKLSGLLKDFFPVDLSEQINQLNDFNEQECKDYQLRKEAIMLEINERQNEVRTILSMAPVNSINDLYFWISSDWLRQWAENLKPTQIDNTLLQCSHQRVPFSKVGVMKRISAQAWEILHSKYGGGPTLTCRDCCIDCLKEMAKTMVSTDGYKDQRAAMQELAEEALNGQFLDGNLHFVSRKWLVQWLRRKNADAPCDADADPTSLLICPHRRLMPEEAPGAKRVLVPESLWLFIYENVQKVKGGDPSGCVVFPIDSEVCPTCSFKQTEVAFSESQLRVAKIKQRHNHEQLYMGKAVTVFPGCKYYLLPSSWLSIWRSYLAVSGRNVASSSPEPECLEFTLDSLRCKKHSRLLLRPFDLIRKRGELVQKVLNTDGLVVITEGDWNLLCDEWLVPEGKGIIAEIDFAVDSSQINTSKIQMEASKEQANFEYDLLKPIIRTFPEVCEDCIGDRETCELMQKLNYCNEDIRVYLVRGKEPPRSILTASTAISERDRRTSKRSRRASRGGSINFMVSGFTTIYQLKMMIWESFGIVKENQKLHKGSVEIEDDSATLADMNILPGDVLWVTDTEVHENRDIADELLEHRMKFLPAEEGFKGTLLASNALAKDKS